MHMPKTTMNKDDCTPSGKGKIRLARKVLPMDTKPVTHPMDQTTDDHFRPRVFSSHRSHYAASFRRCETVDHAVTLARRGSSWWPNFRFGRRYGRDQFSLLCVVARRAIAPHFAVGYTARLSAWPMPAPWKAGPLFPWRGEGERGSLIRGRAEHAGSAGTLRTR